MQGELSYHVVYMVRHPRGTRQIIHSIPIVVSGSGHTRKQINSFDACHPYARESASEEVLSMMQLTPHATRPTPHCASRLVQAMSAWLVKTRRAPSRYYRNAKSVYGHTTTAMHDNEYTAPPPRGHTLDYIKRFGSVVMRFPVPTALPRA